VAELSKRLPQLSRLDGDIFSVPAISAECERVFSSAKLLILDRRNKLGADVIEAKFVEIG
jgi:hypothetical protein